MVMGFERLDVIITHIWHDTEDPIGMSVNQRAHECGY